MINITIVVEDGRVQNIFSDSAHVFVNIIDKDTQDAEELELISRQLEELKKEQGITLY